MHSTDLLAFTFCAGVAFAALANAADDDLRVGTFNIRNSGAKDGENAWPKRRGLVIETVRKADPDIVGFQEVLADQQADLVAGLADYGSVATFRDDGKTQGEAASVFYRKARFDLIESGNFWLSETPEVVGSFGWDAACTRICTWARLKDRINGRIVLAANTHFDHVSDVARVNSSKLIGERLGKLANGAAVVLTGDFNAIETEPAYAVLFDAAKSGGLLLTDTYRIIHPTIEPNEASVHWFKNETEGLRIDWIFCSSQLIAIDSSIDRSTSADGRLPSDHFPIWATLRYAAASPDR